MNMSGGIAELTGMPSNASMWMIVAIVIAAIFIATAVSGLQKGIKLCADINVYGYVVFLLFLLFSVQLHLYSIWEQRLSADLLQTSLKIPVDRSLRRQPVAAVVNAFYWASWMAWAPTSGAFMGRIAYGRTVKQTLGLYVGVCAMVSALWMILVGGNSLFAPD